MSSRIASQVLIFLWKLDNIARNSGFRIKILTSNAGRSVRENMKRTLLKNGISSRKMMNLAYESIKLFKLLKNAIDC